MRWKALFAVQAQQALQLFASGARSTASVSEVAGLQERPLPALPTPVDPTSAHWPEAGSTIMCVHPCMITFYISSTSQSTVISCHIASASARGLSSVLLPWLKGKKLPSPSLPYLPMYKQRDHQQANSGMCGLVKRQTHSTILGSQDGHRFVIAAGDIHVCIIGCGIHIHYICPAATVRSAQRRA